MLHVICSSMGPKLHFCTEDISTHLPCLSSSWTREGTACLQKFHFDGRGIPSLHHSHSAQQQIYPPDQGWRSFRGKKKRNKNVKCYYKPILSTRSEKVKQHGTSMRNAELNNLHWGTQVTRGGITQEGLWWANLLCWKIKLISPHYILCFAGHLKKPETFIQSLERSES